MFTPAPSGTASFGNSPAHNDPVANQQETDHAPIRREHQNSVGVGGECLAGDCFDARGQPEDQYVAQRDSLDELARHDP